MVATPPIARLAPDGSRVTVTLPVEAGKVPWYGHTRFAGPALVRPFDLAPAGQHHVIPRRLFPGARVETFRRTGFDLVLYEAADRSRSCLVYAGPHHEAVTYFGGPAPRRSMLNRLTSNLTFTDSPEGASLTPAAGIQQLNSTVVGATPTMMIVIKSARGFRAELPSWQGAVRGDAEVWKEPLNLDPEQAEALKGTPYEWRYIIANASTVIEVMFSKRPGESLKSDAPEAVVAGLAAEWAE
ncbi:hypothetical protein ACIBG8_26130 [Nonomuraea sp. NPDC050556]|uniref:hypothetical protein n=1 Tax=Nonomuraea sp. NPDC050556 TaxID=3364369 RepID=UPI0037A4AAC8